jgi:hypothetical protein
MLQQGDITPQFGFIRGLDHLMLLQREFGDFGFAKHTAFSLTGLLVISQSLVSLIIFPS